MGQIKFVCSLNLARGCQFTSPEVRTLKRKCFENFKNCSRNRQSPFRVKIFFLDSSLLKTGVPGDEKLEFK